MVLELVMCFFVFMIKGVIRSYFFFFFYKNFMNMEGIMDEKLREDFVIIFCFFLEVISIVVVQFCVFFFI